MTARSYTFSHAITRAPADSAISGLRAVDTGAPDLARFRRHHAAYIVALRAAGVEVIELEPLDAFPDSVFVEDAGLCLPQGAIVMRPGAPSRLGEAAAMRPELAKHFRQVRRIEGPGCIEGGDILVTEREILAGLSARTDAAGIAELARLVADWGWVVRELQTPQGVLHFKTDCALLDAETILTTRRLSASGCFEDYRLIHPADGEEAAANAIRVNGVVILPAGFPRTAEILDGAGYRVRAVPNTEAAKLDGGMSCLSLRFTPPP